MKSLILMMLGFVFSSAPAWQSVVSHQQAQAKKDDSPGESLARMFEAEEQLPPEERVFLQLSEWVLAKKRLYDFPRAGVKNQADREAVRIWTQADAELFLERTTQALIESEALAAVSWSSAKTFFNGLHPREFNEAWNVKKADHIFYFPSLYDQFFARLESENNFHGRWVFTEKEEEWNANLAHWQERARVRNLPATEMAIRLKRLSLREPDAAKREAEVRAWLEAKPELKGEAKALATFYLASAMCARGETAFAPALQLFEAARAEAETDGLKRAIDFNIRMLNDPACSFSCEALWPPSGRPVLKLISRNTNLLAVELSKVNETRLMFPSFGLNTRPQKADFRWEVPVERKPDFLASQTEFQIPEAQIPPGFYLLHLLPEGTRKYLPAEEFVIVADLALAVSDAANIASPRKVSCYVTRATSGQPLKEATVEIVKKNADGDAFLVLASGKTDATGCATILCPEEAKGYGSAIRVTYGAERILETSPDIFRDSSRAITNRETHWFFDRAVYRPGQPLHYEGVVTEANHATGSYRTCTASGEITLTFAAGKNETELAKLPFSTDEHGAFSGNFMIPTNLPPGRITFSSSIGSESSFVKIAHYKRPNFEITFNRPERAIAGQPLTLTGRVTMFNGTPLRGVEAGWKAGRQGSGTVKTAADGSFAITFTPDYSFNLAMTVTDASGETRTTNRNFRMMPAAFRFNLSIPEWNEAGKPVKVEIDTAASGYAPIEGQGKITVFAVEEPKEIQRGASERAVEEWPAASTPRLEQPIAFTPGSATHSLMLPAGLWRCITEANDPATGATFAKTNTFSVLDLNRAATTAHPFLFIAEKDHAEVGESLRVHVMSAYADAFVRIQVNARNGISESFIKRLENGCFTHTIAVKPEHQGNFTVRATLIRDSRVYAQAHTVTVPWRQPLELTAIDVSQTMRPGREETWRIKVSDPKARVTAVLYDASLDTIEPFDWHDFNSRFFRNYTGFSLLRERNRIVGDYRLVTPSSNPDFPWIKPDILRSGHFGYGSTAELTELWAKTASPDADNSPFDAHDALPRSDFRETAFFAPFQAVDADGIATFTFTPPDSLTRWKLRAFAYTDDLRSGTLSAESVTIKPLMITPNLPRFLREGDSCTLSIRLDNTSDTRSSGIVSLYSPDFNRADSQKHFTLSPRDSATFTWTITAPKEGSIALTFRARSYDAADVYKTTIPILSSRVTLTETQPFTLTDTEVTTLKTPWLETFASPTCIPLSLEIETFSSPAWSILSSLPALTEIKDPGADSLFRAYTAYALAEKLLEANPAIAEAGDFFTNPLLPALREEALQKLLTLRNEKTHNWGWFDPETPNTFVSDSILLGFSRLYQLGADTNTCVKTVEPILRRFDRIISKQSPSAAATYARFTFQQHIPAPPNDWYTNISNRLKAPDSLTTQERRLYALAAFKAGMIHEANRELDHLRATLTDSPEWGISWPRETFWWEGWRTPVESHALGMEMLHTIARDSAAITRATQWLLQHKRLNSWETGRATEAALWALLFTGSTTFTASESNIEATYSRGDIASYEIAPGRLGHSIFKINPTRIIAKHDTLNFRQKSPGLTFGSIAFTYSEEVARVKTAADTSKLALEKQFLVKRGEQWVPTAPADFKIGEKIIIRLIATAAQEMSFVRLVHERPAGLEPTDASGTRRGNGSVYFLSVKDSATEFFIETLPRGTTAFETTCRVFHTGNLHDGIATIESLYAPSFRTHTAGDPCEEKIVDFIKHLETGVPPEPILAHLIRAESEAITPTRRACVMIGEVLFIRTALDRFKDKNAAARLVENRLHTLFEQEAVLTQITETELFAESRFNLKAVLHFFPTAYDKLLALFLGEGWLDAETEDRLLAEWQTSARRRGESFVEALADITSLTRQPAELYLPGLRARLTSEPPPEAEALFRSHLAKALAQTGENAFAEAHAHLEKALPLTQNPQLKDEILALRNQIAAGTIQAQTPPQWFTGTAPIRLHSRNITRAIATIETTTERDILHMVDNHLSAETIAEMRKRKARGERIPFSLPDPDFTPQVIQRWEIPIENKTGFLTTETLTAPPEPLPPGFYCLSVMASDSKEISSRSTFTVTSLSLFSESNRNRKFNGIGPLRVVRALSGEPVAGARVDLLNLEDDSIPVLATATTGTDGLCFFPADTPRHYHRSALRATIGAETLTIRGEPDWQLPAPPREPFQHSHFWYFDRCIAHPGQTLAWQILCFNKGATIATNGTFTIEWASGETRKTLATESFTTDSHGHATGSFTIPADLPEGTLTFCTALQNDHKERRHVRITKQPQTPPFEITLNAPPLRAFDVPLTFTGSIEGKPGAEVAWVLEEETSDSTHCNDPTLAQKAEGRITTAPDGTFEITLTPRRTAFPRFFHSASRYRLTATCEGQSHIHRFSVAHKPFTLTCSTPSWNETQNTVTLTLNAKNSDDIPVPTQGHVCVTHTDGTTFKAPFSTQTGKVTLPFTLAPGLWHATAEAAAPFTDATITSLPHRFQVIDLSRPYTGDQPFLFIREKKWATPGEKIRFYWASAHSNDLIRIELFNGNGLISTRFERPSGTSSIFEIPIPTDFPGDFAIGATQIHQSNAHSTTHEIRIAHRKELAITLPPPQQPGTLRIRVNDPTARVSAVVSSSESPHPGWRHLYHSFPYTSLWVENEDGITEPPEAPKPPEPESFHNFLFFHRHQKAPLYPARACVGGDTPNDTCHNTKNSDFPTPPLPQNPPKPFPPPALYIPFTALDANGELIIPFTPPPGRWKIRIMAYTDTLRCKILDANL